MSEFFPHGVSCNASPSPQDCNLQIYVGVLVKYVNFGKGWRHRLFVLKGGVLRYYKVAAAGHLWLLLLTRALHLIYADPCSQENVLQYLHFERSHWSVL